MGRLDVSGIDWDDWIERDRRSVAAARERADRLRADLMLAASRGIGTWGMYEWSKLGWKTALMCDELRHPSDAVAKVFNVPKWRPTDEELAWYRSGFAAQREGRPMPVLRG